MTLSEDCKSVEDALGAVLSGDFSRDEFKRANRHLAQCDKCRSEYSELGAFRKVLTRAYGVSEQSRPRWRQAAAGLALAASLVIGIVATQKQQGAAPFLPQEELVAPQPEEKIVAPEAVKVEVDLNVDVELDIDQELALMSDEELMDIVYAIQ